MPRIVQGIGRPATWLVAAIVVSLFVGPTGKAQSTDEPLAPLDLRIAFTRSSFLGVNEADALAAFKAFTRTVGRRRGYDITPQVWVFDDMERLESEIRLGNLELLVVDSWDYLTILPGTNMPVEFSTIEQGVVRQDYVLLVKAGSGLSGLTDLRGKRISVLESSNANTGMHWLSTELMGIGESSPEAFFGRVEVSHKTSQVVLPVFFGKTDACLVDRSGFEIMDEMNPQVGKTLVVAAHSEPFLDSMICVRKDGWNSPEHRADLIDAMRELNSDPGGKQILSLFRFQGMTPYRREHLETIRALRKRHDLLLAQTASREPKAKSE